MTRTSFASTVTSCVWYRGWRASHAYPKHLYTFTNDAAIAGTIRDRYLVPVECGEKSTLLSQRVPSLTAESLRDIARRRAHEAEREILAEVLERVNWNRAEAARILKVSYKTLLHLITECRLKPPPSRQLG